MKNITKKKNKGFTIVELIVVMAIIAILILIAVPAFTKYIDDANKTSEMGTADTIYKAAIAATVDSYVSTGTTTIDALETEIEASVSLDDDIQVSIYNPVASPSYDGDDDEWCVAIPGTEASDGVVTVDATSNIFVRAPIANGVHNVYENGELVVKP